MYTYLACWSLAFVIAALTTPLVRRLALQRGLLDRASGQRKIHARDTPRIGGVAVALAFYVPILAAIVYGSSVGTQFIGEPASALGLLFGGLMIVALGVVDDIRGLSARPKLLVQLVVAGVLAALGFRWRLPDLGLDPVSADLLACAIGVVWIVGVTNALNLIDGLDGLASGIAFIAVGMLAVVAIANGTLFLALVCATLSGALLGFLLYNFHPAKIFLGDSGSMFLGFVLAVTTIQTSFKSPLVIAVLTPILALGLPIMDTLLAIVRRVRRGKPVLKGDAQHIHHRLLRRVGHRSTVLLLYAISACFAFGALLLMSYRSAALGPVLTGAVVVAALLMRFIGPAIEPGLETDGLQGAASTTTRSVEVKR